MADTPDDARMHQLAQDVSAFMNWANANSDRTDTRSQIARLLHDHLGSSSAQSVVGKDLPSIEHVNLQLAIEHWLAQDGRAVDVQGVFVPRHYGQTDLNGLIAGNGPPVQLVAPPMTDLPDGPRTTRACYVRALFLIEDEQGKYVLLLSTDDHEPVLHLEIAGLPVTTAQQVYAELDALCEQLNVYRGHLVQAHATMSGIRLEFLDPTPMGRERLILPEDVLRRVESQSVELAAHRMVLRGAGQHLKRGVLLYGPPGTGKTHTVRYVLGQMPDYTRVLMQGAALHAIGPAAELARRLAPSVVVLEDVDLVAQDRSFGPGDNPVLFELLDAMDGAADDSDLLFLLTTNRVEVLEEALAARPGRVDVAVHIDRPGSEARARLFRLYAAAAPLELTDELVDEVADATEGVTASFLKELVRRSVLVAAQEDAALTTVTAEHVRTALTDLQDSTQSVTRALLGAGDQHLRDQDDDGRTDELAGPDVPADGVAGAGWFAYVPDSGDTFRGP